MSAVGLIRPPFFSPMSPPLGLGMLKAFLERHGHEVRCYDLNVEPRLWDIQRRYFAALGRFDEIGSRDGHSKLWAVINGHMLAFLAGADAAGCERVVRRIAPLFGLRLGGAPVDDLHALVVAFFERLVAHLDALDLGGCEFVGTSTYTTSLAASLFTLRHAKRRNPAVRTVMGGGVFADDLALGSDNLATLLREYDFVDHAVLGEGELLLLRLVEGEFAGRRVVTVADLGRDVLDFAELPAPDFTDFGMESYLHLTIEGGRSCPFQCSFCSETIQWGSYRKKPAALLAEQVMGLAERHGNARFFLGDSLINPYVAGLSNELLVRGARLHLDGYLRADKHVADRVGVAAWARAGLYRVRLGLESAAPHVLELMGKRTTPGGMLDALRALSENGIRTTTYWVAGHPGETEADFAQTLAFVREAHRFIYELEVHPFYYYPYGQVASRLYDCASVFPPEVTDVIRFRTWEVVGREPLRAERFARLQRFTALAVELGIPNIYSMQERYAAEERWQRLAPAMSEIY